LGAALFVGVAGCPDGCSSDCCVTGNLAVKTSGTFDGGFDVDSYIDTTNGVHWGTVDHKSQAGSEAAHRNYKVQLNAPHTGTETCGVSQTMTHGPSNQSFLDGTAAYLGMAAGSVRVGDTLDEPLLDSADPYALSQWFPRFASGEMSFADVPSASLGDEGSITFETCFYSKGGSCALDKCCVAWIWTVDYTGYNTTNTVTEGTASCQ
jgi:hypothetical protein